MLVKIYRYITSNMNNTIEAIVVAFIPNNPDMNVGNANIKSMITLKAELVPGFWNNPNINEENRYRKKSTANIFIFLLSR